MLVVTEAARRRRRRSRRRPRQWLRRGQWQWPQLPQSVVIRGRARLVVCGLVSLYLTEQATEAEAAWVASASAVSAQRTEEKESQNVLRGLHKAFSWEAEGRETVTTRYINPKSIDLE